MNKSELIENLVERLAKEKGIELNVKDVELAVKHIIDYMTDALASGQRIEIRGFGSFSLRYRPPRMGRNPRTGEPVPLPAKHVPHFKPGKDLRERVNAAAQGRTKE
ncbi:integration host factor subunit beta [Methylomarinovum tepidoasis]|uniref:Integration host factor subunit beta n=1 Tax=Methylomarinovum tepidoasis TaxID=2840183 RepID=A0AAU9CYS1_9GAMM|nr:integration host factor subunit beta [Methylomarinovum sp. IN45]